MSETEKNKSGKSKHLFGSSDKSDFIVNMSVEKAQKLCGVYSIIAVLILAVISIPYYFTQKIKFGTDGESKREIYLNEKLISVIAMAVLAVGFLGFIFFLIANMKKIVGLRSRKSLVIGLGIIVMTVISCVTSQSVFYAIYGYLDRAEGLLAIIGYWGLFSMAMTVTADKWRIKLSDFLVGLGVFQALAGILQVIPATAKIVPNYFKGLYLRPGLNTDKAGEFAIKSGENIGIYMDKNVASGFLCSPHALTAVLTITFAFACIGFIFEKSKGRKIFYSVSAPVIAAAAFLTCTQTAVVGIISAAVITLIFAIIKLAGKSGKGRGVSFGGTIGTLAVTAVIGGILFGTHTAQFLDEKIIFTDSFVRLSVSSEQYMTYHNKLALGTVEDEIYSLLQTDAINTIKEKPVLGVGPENWPAMQEMGSFLDKSYNEFLDVAQTRGVICLGLYILFLIVTLVRGIKACVENFRSEKGSYIIFSAVGGAVAYIAQSFLNISSVTSAPYFWIALGLIWSYDIYGTKKKAKTTEE